MGSFFPINDFSLPEIANYVDNFFRLTIFRYLNFSRSIGSFFPTNDFSLLEIDSYVGSFFETNDISVLEILDIYG